MVDSIEIKLDEIEDHVLRTQADVDRLMRDFSKPDSNKQILASSGIGGGGGGFMNQLMQAIGGGKGGLMGAGVAGGLAAGGVIVLADVMKNLIGQSKIVTTILGTIGKALGLLIDVILLPFLPVLAVGIIWLYQGIMSFSRIWSATVKTLMGSMDSLTGSMKSQSGGGAGAGMVGLALGGGLIAALATAILTGLITAVAVSSALAGLAVVLVGALTAAIILVLAPLAYQLGQVVGKIVYDAGYQFAGLVKSAGAAFGSWLAGIPEWISTGLNNAVKTITDFFSNIGTMIVNAINEGISSSVGKTGASAVSAVGGAVSDPVGWLGGALSQIGGGKSSGGNQTIVIQGYTDQKLVKTIENLQRTQNRVYGN